MVKHIVFLLPHDGIRPAGGYKVVYEYANRLVKDGFNVTLVYPNTKKWNNHSGMLWLKDVMRYIVRKMTKGYRPKWFSLDKQVKQKWVWSLDTYKYQRDTIIVATAVETAYYLNQYSIPSKQKFYFIQDFEDWYFSRKFVLETYHYKMNKIVISKWLHKIVTRYNEYAVYIPNGFDFNFFHNFYPINERNRFHIACMFHIDERKGLDVAFRAFDLVKKKYPEVKVTLFSVYAKPDNLDTWYHFYQQPDKQTFNRIYNDAAIFVGASNTEGWGLTIGEAMQCGCAVVCTDNNGYLEMAQHGETALVSPVGNSEALADNICKLIENDELRINIATNGEKFIRQFDIENSYKRFRDFIVKKE